MNARPDAPLRARRTPRRERGAALLLAMLVVTLVATLAARTLWQRWRAIEVETAERTRAQAEWLLTGAADWARLILREDARSGGADHLGEPWSVPLQESRLSSFVAAGGGDTSGIERDAFLSGAIVDLQGRLNLTNLVEGDRISKTAQAAFTRLYRQLGLPESEVDALAQALLDARRANAAATSTAPLPPERYEDLAWLGLPAARLQQLEPFVTLLPEPTPVNVNTAPPEVLIALSEKLSPSDLPRLLQERANAHFSTTLDPRLGPALLEAGTRGQIAVASRYFQIRIRVRLDALTVEEVLGVRRDGLNVLPLWRTRSGGPSGTGAPLQSAAPS
jgi:general secretion pathway protein K